MIWFVIQLRVWWSLLSKKWLRKSQIFTFNSCQGMVKSSACLCTNNGTTSQNYSLDFWPYLSNAVELRHISCAKMISSIRRFQPHPQWCAMMIIMFCKIWTLTFCPHTLYIGCFACLKMHKITKCVCMLEIGSLYVVWHEFFDIQCTYMMEIYSWNLFLSETTFQGGYITKNTQIQIQLGLPILAV